MTRRAQPIHRRKRKAETPPSDGEEVGVAGPEEKRVRIDEPEGSCVNIYVSIYRKYNFSFFHCR